MQKLHRKADAFLLFLGFGIRHDWQLDIGESGYHEIFFECHREAAVLVGAHVILEAQSRVSLILSELCFITVAAI